MTEAGFCHFGLVVQLAGLMKDSQRKTSLGSFGIVHLTPNTLSEVIPSTACLLPLTLDSGLL